LLYDVRESTVTVVYVCAVMLLVTHNSKRLMSLIEAKLELPVVIAERFVFIAVDFSIRM